ncbi:MATE efflux family protein 1 [Hordeum vulgare]|nr:MATE efflux family protein 1 [Hordeum vulgare]
MDLPSFYFHGATLAFQRDNLGKEIMEIAVPGALALMADPLASLVDTAFIGHIGVCLPSLVPLCPLSLLQT